MTLQPNKISCLALFMGSTLLTTMPLCAASANDGLTFGMEYVAGYSAAPMGDADGDPTAKQRTTLNLAADLEKAWGWNNTSFFFQYQNHNGEHGASQVHDIQQYDGLDDPEYERIHMFWFQRSFIDNTLRIKIGKVEPKSEFFAPANAGHHLGVSTERSPTIIAQGPPSFSVNAFYSPSDEFTFALGVYDAAWNTGRDQNNFKMHTPFEEEDIAVFTEARFSTDEGLMGRATGVKAGVWLLQGDKTRFDGGVEESTLGFYLTADQTVSDNGIGVYAQYGYSDDAVSALSSHVGLGLQWVGPFDSRADDVFGVGISHVSFSSVTGSPFTEDAEVAYELFYKSPVTPWFTLQGDLQQITSPGGMGAEDALVATIRGSFHFQATP